MSVDEIFERFEIEFDAGPEPLFHGGELITGNLRVNLKQKITINFIRLQFKGRACWLPENSKSSEEEKVYFDKDFVLLERPPGRPEPGHFPWNANFTYSLPFECPLPKGCPTSYESPFAFVRYFARCTIETDEPTQYLVKKAFTIVSPPELRHLLPPPEHPVTRQDVSTFGGCCCRGKITGELTLPKSAYAPGEAVIGVLTVDNRHPRYIVEQIEVRLVDRVKKASDVPPHVDSMLDEPTKVVADRKATNAINANDAVGESAASPKDEKSKKVKKRAVKKYQKNNAPPIVVNKASKHEGQHRVIFVRHLEHDDVIKSKSSVTRPDLFLLTIPPVPTSTISESAEADINDQLISLSSAVDADGRLSKLLESPSTATFRLRRQPFIRIEYALQVSIGSHLLIEVPIEVHPIPIYANGIDFRPFAAGEQPITEADETGKKTFHGPFKFVPLYPTYLASPKPVQILNSETITVKTANTPVDGKTVDVKTNDIPNGGISNTTTKMEEMTAELPDGSKLIHHKRQQITTTSSSSVTATTPHIVVHSLNPSSEIVETPYKAIVEEPQQNDVQQQIPIQESAHDDMAGSSEPQHEETKQPHMEEQANEEIASHLISAPEQIREPAPSQTEIVEKINEPEVVEDSLNENGIVEEPVELNGKHHDSNVSVVEHTETQEQQLKNGHVLHTTVTTKTITPTNGVENGDKQSAPKIVETTVEEVEYDENGDKVRVQKSTESSEQNHTIVTHSENSENINDAIPAE